MILQSVDLKLLHLVLDVVADDLDVLDLERAALVRVDGELLLVLLTPVLPEGDEVAREDVDERLDGGVHDQPQVGQHLSLLLTPKTQHTKQRCAEYDSLFG